MQLLVRSVRFLSVVALVCAAVLIGNAGPAAAANPLLCFDGTTDTANGDTGGIVYGGTCTLNASGTGATLNNTVPVGSSDYSGVYYATSDLSGQLLGDVTQLGFSYTGLPTAGSPRISLPIDSNSDGSTDFYAFIGAFYCNNGAGVVDAINDSTCTIFYTGGPVSGDANWATFAAAHPTWRVGPTPFVVADDPGLWTVSNVQLGQAAAAASHKDKCKSGGWMTMHRADGTSFKNQGDCIQYVNTGK